MQNAAVPPQDRSGGPTTDHGPDDARENLLRFAELGGFTLAADTHAWYAALDTVAGPEEARAASTVLAEVRGGGLSGLLEAATALAADSVLREPATIAEVNALVALGRRLQDTAATLGVSAYDADLDALAAATASGTWRKERGLKLSWGRRRKLRAQARALAVVDRPRREALHAALVAAAAERTDWAALGDGSGVRPMDGGQLEATAQAVDALTAALRELGRLLPDRDLPALPFAELADLVDRLAADEGTLYRLPELRTLRTALEAAGLDELLAELTAAGADRAATEAAYRRYAGDAEAGAVAAAVVEPVAEVDDEVDAEAEAAADAARQVLAAGPREALDEAPTEHPEPLAEVEAEVEPVVEVEIEVAAEVEVEPVVEVEPEVAAEVEVEPVVEAEPIVEPVAEVTPEPEPEPEPAPAPAPVVEAVVEAEPAPELAPAKRARRPRKPDFTPGRPVTAYTPAELVAVVRWIDGDDVERSDDELLRAAMKELGFARLGPRIKEALGTAVAEARA
ncbi:MULTISPECIES: hypothetical protein [unclassified Kitasatospora]|uniref:hypothetical protein n=1 Tax=unclassified Kitasatospora TaxID=2633591 RepID=UPI0024771C49|nr:hypothetical protein [Kitasatospora sp. MAP12-44]